MFPETEFEGKTRSFELTEFAEEDWEKRAQFAKGAELRSALGKNILLSETQPLPVGLEVVSLRWDWVEGRGRRRI